MTDSDAEETVPLFGESSPRGGVPVMWVGAYLVGGLLCAATVAAIPQPQVEQAQETEVNINGTCTYNEQCEAKVRLAECKDNRCVCRFEMKPVLNQNNQFECIVPEPSAPGKFGDRCTSSEECGFIGSHCENGACSCRPGFPATNHFDKCGVLVDINGTCFFTEQCEVRVPQTDCKDGRCSCKFEMKPIINKNNQVECIADNVPWEPERYVDPTMIGVLVGMALMFIIICVVLRLFSKARWRENRTIFNTPNPRLMNVSLLRDTKPASGERRGSRGSNTKPPSRQPSLASLRPTSPAQSHGSRVSLRGSLRGSRSSSGSVRSPSTGLQKDELPPNPVQA